MNVLEQMISYISPKTALNREKARKALELGTRAYEGATTGRRGEGWFTQSSSANVEIRSGLNRLRDRARDLVRNNPHANRIVEIWVSNLVGTGLQPQSRTESDALNNRVEKLFAQWSSECDADGTLNYYGIQALAVRSMVESGESLIRFRVRRESDGLLIPLQLQVLESDHIDESKDAQIQNGEILLGIEFDKLGRRRFYHLFAQHPYGYTNQLGSILESKPVAASEVLHLYKKDRPSQIRGVTWLAPVMLKLRDLDDYQDTHLIKAKVEACFSAFVVQNDPDSASLGTISERGTGRVEGLEPGMLAYLSPGESVEFASPTSHSDYSGYVLQCLMGIAIGSGLTVDQLTGDLRNANYSSLRAGKIEFRRIADQIQNNIIIPTICAPVWKKFIEYSILSGKLPDREYPVEFIPPRHELIDPNKDIQADILAVRAGFVSLPQMIAKYGNDFSSQMEMIAKANEVLDKNEIILDVDPRVRSRDGNAQQDGESNGESDSGDNGQTDGDNSKPAKQPIGRDKNR